MSRLLSRFAAVAVLAAGLTALAVADDDKKPAEKKPEPAKPADWSAFAAAGEIHGEVVKADDSGFTLRVSWLAPAGKSNTRAKQFRPQAPNEKYQDYQLTFADPGLARWKTLPTKGTDEKGKAVPYTEKERTELRKPTSAPGYAAEHGDLKPGHLVEVTLVRPKEISSEKATLQDLKVKYAVIVGTDPKGPPADAKGERKKKKDK